MPQYVVILFLSSGSGDLTRRLVPHASIGTQVLHSNGRVALSINPARLGWLAQGWHTVRKFEVLSLVR